MDPDSILEIVERIYKSTHVDKKVTFQNEYAGFAKQHPVLFEMACSNDFDFGRFKNMLLLKKSIDEGKISQHDASVKVGSVLYDAYVKDKLPNTN